MGCGIPGGFLARLSDFPADFSRRNAIPAWLLLCIPGLATALNPNHSADMSPARLAELTELAESIVEEIRADLPDNVRPVAAECPAVLLTMEAWAAEQDELVDEELLGLFTGCSRADGVPAGPAEAPQILLFVDNLWAFAEHDRDAFAEEVETTFLHELGHYLGLDEDEIEARGLA